MNKLQLNIKSVFILSSFLVIIWVFISFFVAYLLLQLSIGLFLSPNSTININSCTYKQLFFDTSELDSARIELFSSFFQILAGIGSVITPILVTLYLYKKDKNEKDLFEKIHDYSSIRLQPVQDHYFTNAQREIVQVKQGLLGMKNSLQKGTNYAEYQLEKDGSVANFVLIKKYKNIKKFVYDVVSSADNGDPPLLFIIMNNGKLRVQPVMLTIYYLKSKITGSGLEKYTNSHKIDEVLEEFSYLIPNKSPLLIHADKKNGQKDNKYKKYEDFFDHVCDEFAIIVEYKVNSEKVIRAFNAKYIKFKIDDREGAYISNIAEMPKMMVKESFDSCIADEILKYYPN